MWSGRRRRERELNELLARMARLDDQPVSLYAPAYVVGPARRRSGLPWLLVLLVFAALLAAWQLGWASGLGDIGRPPVFIEVDGRAVAVPTPPENSVRLLPAVPASTHGTHAFLYTQPDGKPVGYDPCRPIRYVIRPDGMPEVGADLISEAVAEISTLTGLKFEYLGTTTERPQTKRAVIQPSRYGDDWAPVLIAWTNETELPEVQGAVAGIGGSAEVPGARGSGHWLVAGRVALDTTDMMRVMAYRNGRAQARGVILHELAHVVGLDHVQDRTELMYPETESLTGFGPGDREGLALVGQVSCERG